MMAAQASRIDSNAASSTQEYRSTRLIRWIPSLLWLLAAVLLGVSISVPYWGLVLHAPQYPGGLEVRLFVNYLTGDEDPRRDEVREIDGLNHYIGMKSLVEAAKVERSIALPGVIVMIGALAIVAVLRRRRLWLFTIPVIAFPAVYLGDLAFWLNYYGQNLDPYAPLSSAISPFTPPLIGDGVIGQFSTTAYVNTGWYLALGAAVATLLAVVIFIIQKRREPSKVYSR